MRGTLHYIFPGRPIEVHILSSPIGYDKISADLGGLVELVQYWDHHLTFDGRVVPAMALVNEEALQMDKPFNFWATAAWQFVMRAKGIKLNQSLYGLVILATGDEEFLENLV